MSKRISLPEKWVQFLLRQPESGMGYQRVKVVFDDSTKIEDCLVFNAEEIELPDKYAGKVIRDISVQTGR